jgi:HEAT repeat protein
MTGDLEVHRKLRRARREGDVETLIALLDDEIEGSLAATYLGDLGAVAAIPALAALMEATDPHKRASAVLALGKLDASDACPRIAKIAEQDEVPWVRACATQALGALPCDSGGLFIRALADSDIRVRRVAVVALMDTGRPAAIPELRAARKREHWYSRGIYRKAIRRLKRQSR